MVKSQSEAEEKPKNPKKGSSKRTNLHLEHKPSDEMDLLISTLNDADLGWKADTCKLQKHHAKYGQGQVCEGQGHGGLLLAQTGSKSGAGIDGGAEAKEFAADGDKDFQKTLK